MLHLNYSCCETKKDPLPVSFAKSNVPVLSYGTSQPTSLLCYDIYDKRHGGAKIEKILVHTSLPRQTDTGGAPLQQTRGGGGGDHPTTKLFKMGKTHKFQLAGWLADWRGQKAEKKKQHRRHLLQTCNFA